MKMIRLLDIALLVFFLIPTTSIAANVVQPDDNFRIQTTNSTSLIVTVQNEQNSRFLGDVQINISSQNYTIPDPPPPGGYQINGLPKTQIEIVAQRKGYQIYDQKQTLADKKFNQLTIRLKPQAGTPVVNESSLMNGSSPFYGTGQWPSNYQNSGSLTGDLPSVLNPYLNNYANLNNLSGYSTNQALGQNTSFLGNSLQNLLGNQNTGLTNFNTPYLDSTVLKNYNLTRSQNTGDIYQVNNQNSQDARRIIFVDRGDGKGGLAFIPSGSTYDVSYNSQNESRWYVTLYNVGSDGAVSIIKDKISAVNFTPQEYANTVRGTIISNLNILK